MRVVIDEDIPYELTPLFRGPGLVVKHVEDLGFKGKKNGELLTAQRMPQSSRPTRGRGSKPS